MKTKQAIRQWLIGFILLLIISGLTAFPLHAETTFMKQHLDWFPPVFHHWILTIDAAVQHASPLMHYGTDWLAFAHIVIALFFIPVYRDPVRYSTNIRMGQMACVLVIPLALICGPIRSIPLFHQLIDCSFGVLGCMMLQWIYIRIKRLAAEEQETASSSDRQQHAEPLLTLCKYDNSTL